MKITTTVGQLKQAIKAVLVAVNAKTCDLHVNDGRLYVKASNHAGYCRVDLDASVPKGAAACAGIGTHTANVIFGTVASDMEVTITPVETGIRLRYGGSNLKLNHSNGELADEALFKIAQSCEGRVPVTTCKGEDLINGFETTQHFAASGDVRQYLCGVYLEDHHGKLRMTATNGFMLNSVDTELRCELKGFNAIIPNTAAQAIEVVFKGDEEIQLFQVGDGTSKKIVLKTDRLCWINYLVVGDFPNYQQLLASEATQRSAEIVVPRKEMVNAISRVLAVSNGPYVKVKFAGGVVTVLSPDEEQKEQIGVQELTEEAFPGVKNPEWEAGFSGDLLSEIVNRTPSANILFRKSATLESKLYVRPMKEKSVSTHWVAMLMTARL